MGIAASLQSDLFFQAFAHSAIGMALCAPDGRWLEVNDALCGFLGYTREELLERTYQDITHPDDLAPSVVRVREVLNGVAPAFHAEKRYVRKDGSIVWAAVSVSLAREEDGRPAFFIAQAVDISQKKQNDQVLMRTNRALRTLSAVNGELIHAQEESVLLDAVCAAIVSIGGYRMAWVGVPEEGPEQIVRPIAHFGDDGFLRTVRISWGDNELGQGPTGTAVRSGVMQTNKNFATNPRMTPWRAEALKRGYIWSVAFPLAAAGKVFGVLTIYSGEPDAFNDGELAFLHELADDLAFGITTLRTRTEYERVSREHAQHEATLRESLIESIRAIAYMVELRDPYTAGHESRVSDLAAAIGHELGLTADRIEGLRLAALIHDVGKIKVPAEILNKPGKLNPIELALIKMHPQSGYDILKDIRFPWPIARMVYEHHERLDGSGYPNGLRGAEILLESQILAVADVVDAMNSHRPYRAGLGLEAALAEVAAHRGLWYDAAVCDACTRLFREGRFSFA